jgi:flagellar assembly protein FliH
MTGLARIIRAERRGPAVVHAELYEAQLTAAQLRAQTQTELAGLRARTEAELAAQRRAASEAIEQERTAARASGYEEGIARAAREWIELTTARAHERHREEAQLRELVMRIAGKLAQRAFEAEPDRIEALIEPLLTLVRRARRLVLRVHPDDAKSLTSRLTGLTDRLELEATLELTPDETIERGGCAIESDLGELDARLSTRLAEFGRALGWESA